MFTARKNYDGSVERSMDTTQSIGATSPKFSVVVPLYNKGQSIKDTINSVLEQSFRDFELIIVNDGSADNSLQVVREIKDSRIRIIDKKNGGVSSARNRGIAEAKNEWIALLDGDDLWLPNHLEDLARAIEVFPDHKVFYTGWTTSEEKDFRSGFNEFAVEVDDYFRFALNGYGMWSSCVCFHSSLQKKMQMFCEYLTRGEDLDLWRRFVMQGKPVFVPTRSAIYRTDGENRVCLSSQRLSSRLLWWLPLSSLKGAEYAYFSRMYVALLWKMLRRNPWSFFLLVKRQGVWQSIKAFFNVL